MTTGNEYWSKMTCPIVRYTPVQVRKPIAGTLEQEVKSVHALYRRRPRKSLTHDSALLIAGTDREAVQKFMEDYCVPQELIERTLAEWDVQMTTVLRVGGGRLYRWKNLRQGDGSAYTDTHWTFDTVSILALINALVKCMPEPVQAIRNSVVHGKNVQSVSFDYDDDVETYTRFVVAVCVPYAVRKISAYERQITGQVYERSLHRTTDMGQAGRRFSDADVSDILSRTILASFFPLYCRTLPLTDKGKAYVLVKSCTLLSCAVGKKEYTMIGCTAKLTKLWDTVKAFRAGKMTEQEYSDFLSTYKPPAVKKRREMTKQTFSGFWITWKCDQTGQLFRVFTRSANKAEELRTLKSFSGEVDKVIPVDKNEVTEMDCDSVYGWSVDGAFFRSLKAMTRNLYRFLMRRTNHDDILITEHADSRRLRKTVEHPFSLNEVLTEHDDTLTTVQKDIIKVELSTDEVPKNVHRNNRKVWLYNLIVETRTGVNPKLTRYQYEQMRGAEFHCISVQLGLVDPDQTEQVYTDDAEANYDGQLYSTPLWMRERSDRGQLTSFETAFAVQSGIDRRTVYRSPDGPTIFPEVYKRIMSGSGGYEVPVQLKPVQYPQLSRTMARFVAGVRAISGLSGKQKAGVQVKSFTVNGFTVPVWVAETDKWMEVSTVNELSTQAPKNGDVYGSKVVQKTTSTRHVHVKGELMYTDVCTASGDGI